MAKILVAIIPPDEWNQYICFNGFLYTIKKDYDYIIGVVAENPLILISEANEYYSIKNDELNEFKYPLVLDTKMIGKNDYFVDKCVNKIIDDFKNDNLSFISWQPTNFHTSILGPMSVTDQYRTAFKYAQKWYQSGGLIFPTHKTYYEIKNKYSHMFNNNTFIILSRNFKNKALIHNSEAMMPNFKNLIAYLAANNIRIINIGFPPVSCNISDNYYEINENLTQNELISLFYLSNGVITQADSGGFISHFAANADFFTLTSQWSLSGEEKNFDVISKKSKDSSTIDLQHYIRTIHNLSKPENYDAIVQKLNNHKVKRTLKFSEEKRITYVK